MNHHNYSRYVVGSELTFDHRRVVYIVIDLEANTYYEASWTSPGAHERALRLNSGAVPRDQYKYLWKPIHG